MTSDAFDRKKTERMKLKAQLAISSITDLEYEYPLRLSDEDSKKLADAIEVLQLNIVEFD